MERSEGQLEGSEGLGWRVQMSSWRVPMASWRVQMASWMGLRVRLAGYLCQGQSEES